MSNISVILPIFNGSKYISQAINSVLNQTYKNFELIIINDGSTENIDVIINNYNDSRIRYYSRSNKGLGYTLNELVSLTNYEYIFRMDADDCSDSHRLEKQMEYMLQHDDVVMCGTNINIMTDKGIIPHANFPTSHEDIIKDLLNYKFSICHPSIVFKKSAFNKIGGYKVLGAGEDLDFFLRISNIGKIVNIPNRLLNYRIHLNSLNLNKFEELENNYRKAVFLYKNNYKELVETFKVNPYHILLRKFSTIWYRKYIIYQIENKYCKAYLYLILTVLIKPVSALKTLKKMMGHNTYTTSDYYDNFS